MNFSRDPLTLEKIRNELVKIEDTIIFALIERASFAQNKIIYEEGKFEFKDFNGSFLDFFMHEMESVHAKVRRYTSPDEYPFSTNLPQPILPSLPFPKMLTPNNINLNPKLKKIYLSHILPLICKPGDDSNYGSSATKDVEALQILSRRIHFGKFVAESKFQDPKYHDTYVTLIQNRDSDGIMKLLTNTAVEERLLRRVRKKAMVYGQEVEEGGDEKSKQGDGYLKIPLDVVADMYEKYIIPLTKEVEVEYLMQRLDHPDFKPEIDYGYS
ncbi:chorismate mutase aro7, partial [Blyttiomyces sp. JEL0837]